MEITVISHSVSYYTTRRLIEAASAQGHRVSTLYPVTCALSVGSDGVEIYSDGIQVPCPEVVIPRIGATLTDWSLRLLDGLVSMGATSVLTPQAIRTCCDKMETHRRLVQAGIPTVPSTLIREISHIDWSLQKVGNLPIVVKPPGGAKGKGVQSAHSREDAHTLIGSMIDTHGSVIVQPLVPMKAPKDLRVLVVGHQAIAAYWRHAVEGDFRSNVHCGGRVEAVPVDGLVGELAVKSAKAVGASICGVDLIPNEASDTEPFFVLEVNASPGLEGIEKATGQRLAERMIQVATSR